MLKQTKNWLRQHDFEYHQDFIRPLMGMERTFVLKFGRDNKRNSRVIVKYRYTFFGKLKITELDLHIHGQHNPRVFASEADFIEYLEQHLEKIKLDAYKHPERLEAELS